MNPISMSSSLSFSSASNNDFCFFSFNFCHFLTNEVFSDQLSIVPHTAELNQRAAHCSGSRQYGLMLTWPAQWRKRSAMTEMTTTTVHTTATAHVGVCSRVYPPAMVSNLYTSLLNTGSATHPMEKTTPCLKKTPPPLWDFELRSKLERAPSPTELDKPDISEQGHLNVHFCIRNRPATDRKHLPHRFPSFCSHWTKALHWTIGCFKWFMLYTRWNVRSDQHSWCFASWLVRNLTQALQTHLMASAHKCRAHDSTDTMQRVLRTFHSGCTLSNRAAARNSVHSCHRAPNTTISMATHALKLLLIEKRRRWHDTTSGTSPLQVASGEGFARFITVKEQPPKNSWPALPRDCHLVMIVRSNTSATALTQNFVNSEVENSFLLKQLDTSFQCRTEHHKNLAKGFQNFCLPQCAPLGFSKLCKFAICTQLHYRHF